MVKPTPIPDIPPNNPREELTQLLPDISDEVAERLLTTAKNAIARKETETLENARKEVSEKMKTAPLDKIQKANKALD